jgi:hypothetical protein
MKTVLFLLLFTWVAQSESIKQASAKPPGYWPIESAVVYQAVMPVINRELVAEDKDDSGNLPNHQINELILASLAGAVSITPYVLLPVY